tara:strand:- start:304 stop:645 length:342 start_codon:yes stop_codon:yes gene_type:complete
VLSEKAEILARSTAVHKGVDRGIELAMALGLKGAQYASAKSLAIKISGDERWNNQRSPHGLMIDCLYLCVKREGGKTSFTKIRDLTLKIFGVGTQPRPNEWQKEFTDFIEAWL